MAQTEPRIQSEKKQENDFSAHETMEGLLDKLKVLKYEADFLNALKMRPLHRYYFVVTKNPGEQFYLFSMLASWLIGKTGRIFEQPQEHDDPNETVEKILNVVREIGIPVEFPPNKLKQGVGDQVVYVLNSLVNYVLTKNSFVYEHPQLIEEKEEEAEVIEDEYEINLDRVEEEMMAAYSDDSDEENLFHLDSGLKLVKMESQQMVEQKTNVDEEAWKLELERVLPQLRVTIRNDNRDWRSHVEQMKKHKENIDGSLALAKGQLEKVHKEIGSTLSKIGNREKYLNRELENVLHEYRMVQDQLFKVKDKYGGISGGVSERNRELAKLTDRLETLKQQMEERGSSMTDGTPLVNIKKSVAKMKSEIVDMDVRIGVLECLLLQSRIRDERLMESEFGQIVMVN